MMKYRYGRCKMPLWNSAYRCAFQWKILYKCKHSKHNNISAIKAHEQFLNVCDLMSVPDKIKEKR
jgi:hypothetical protein